ncbi:MAG: hypothetical protein EA420_11965 [Candidatus Competibacteraceae bacterium]|nr:MAG: hypothetical protein EA420_11965 [Candidatus Competibacteraceae bacterium]
MTTFHDLRLRRLELLEELDELEAAVEELTIVLSASVALDSDESIDRHERRAWLQRQHAGVLVILSETERALLEFSADGWDEV